MIQKSNDGLVVEVSDNDDNNELEETPSATEMQECLRQLFLGLDRFTTFQRNKIGSGHFGVT